MTQRAKRFLETLEHRSPLFWTITGFIVVGLLGLIDYATGNEFTLSLFYLIPVVLVTWAVDYKTGLFLSFISGLTLLGAEIAAGQTYSHSIFYFLNTLVRTAFYVVVVYLVTELQSSRNEEQLAARTDYITGAVNARYFNELLQMEISRIRRYPHPITLVYVDIDNFKLVNDLFGHKIGDNLLRFIATELKSQLRITDTVARLGGDEFVLLLPSTRQPEARLVVSKVYANLMEKMQQQNWPVTFSMGAVSCEFSPYSAEQLVNMADELMYEVKNSTKNDIRFRTWVGENSARY
ncbi:MAG TPA: GGDEF domain-containing protein [Anaerolineales bacterium]|nr:GGDEF domain-containing protein [Anaerolineales bacterium]